MTAVVSVALITALALGAGCGGGGGGGNDNGTAPCCDPTRTPTPASAPTHTAVATSAGHTPVAPTSTPAGATPNDGVTPTDGVTPSGPVPTATPSGATSQARVELDVGASAPVLGFQFSVMYPTAKGSFAGSAGSVDCGTPAREIFTKNDEDDGTLILSLAFPTALALPTTIVCTFDVAAGAQLGAADLAITDTEVTVLSNDQKGMVGDASTLTVDVAVR